MRQVHEGRQVAHLWANKSQERARNHNGQFYFEGDTIYSYGHHFPIARHVTLPDRSAAVLFTTRRYSVTTFKHIGFVHNALRGNARLIWVANPEHEPLACWIELKHSLAEKLRIAAGIPAKRPARVRDAYAEYLADLERANVLHEAFGVGERIEAPENMALILEATRNHLVREAAENEARAKKLAASLRRKNARQFKAWIAGEDVAFPSGYGEKIYLRVKDGEVQTSKGARVPVRDAWRVLDAARHCREQKAPLELTCAVGQFRLDRIDADGTAHIGCHTLDIVEMERCASTVQRD